MSQSTEPRCLFPQKLFIPLGSQILSGIMDLAGASWLFFAAPALSSLPVLAMDVASVQAGRPNESSDLSAGREDARASPRA